MFKNLKIDGALLGAEANVPIAGVALQVILELELEHEQSENN